MDAIVYVGLARMILEGVIQWREDAKQKQELTPEQEAALDAELEKIYTLPHWQRLPEDK